MAIPQSVICPEANAPTRLLSLGLDHCNSFTELARLHLPSQRQTTVSSRRKDETYHYSSKDPGDPITSMGS